MNVRLGAVPTRVSSTWMGVPALNAGSSIDTHWPAKREEVMSIFLPKYRFTRLLQAMTEKKDRPP